MSSMSSPLGKKGGEQGHLDEMTCMLYLERQLERTRALEVSAHTQGCDACRTLLRAIERESRLLTRAMLEEEEPLPARIATFQERAVRSRQWIWMAAFGLAATAVYAMYTGYVEPLQQGLETAGLGGTNLLSLLIFQGAFWKGWQSMISLVEVLALLGAAGFAMAFVRRRIRRGSAIALVLASLCAVFSAPAPAGATEFRRKGETAEVRKDENIKGNIFLSGKRVEVEGTVDGDVFAAGKDIEIDGHITGDLISAGRTVWIRGQVDGNVRSVGNTITVIGKVGKNISYFGDTFRIDAKGVVDGSAMMFGSEVNIEGRLGRDVLFAGERVFVNGTVGGGIDEKGAELEIGSGAQVGGLIRFQGENEPVVSSGARLASPVQFTRHVRHHEKFGKSSVVWAVLLAGAFVLFGLVLFLVMPNFSQEAMVAAESYGASAGLGVLVLFAVPIASLIACVTFVGLFIGASTFVLWLIALYAAQTVVGAVIGQWIMGRTADLWGRIGRMAIGVLMIRAVTLLPHGGWIKLLVLLWGIGAISLALYRRFQPPKVAQALYVPPSLPVHPLTPAGGAPAV
jgi:hypothetical protein